VDKGRVDGNIEEGSNAWVKRNAGHPVVYRKRGGERGGSSNLRVDYGGGWYVSRLVLAKRGDGEWVSNRR